LIEVSLTIRRGESIAFVGASGAGKTTIVDLLIGLLEPTSGTIDLDGQPLVGDRLVKWRRAIGYIPQQVYLCDDSVLRNIAFGVEDSHIDRDRAERAIEAARLRELVESLPDGLETFVGERGVRLSATAAAHRNRPRTVPRATGARAGRGDLGARRKTEHEIVEAIERIRSERTALIIAHRLSTVRNCRSHRLHEGRPYHPGRHVGRALRRQREFRHLVHLADAESGTPALAAVPA